MCLLASYLFSTYFENHLLICVLGVWSGDKLVPVSGIIYYLSAPHGLTDAIFHLVHTLIYASLTAIVCAYLSKLWTDVSGSSSRDVACQLKDQQVTLLAIMMFQCTRNWIVLFFLLHL